MSDEARAADPGIRLLLRDDFPAKSGGDLVLAREYEAALRQAGADVRLEPVSTAGRGGPGQTVQLFNVDRYFEFAVSARRVLHSGRPLVVAPVHHPVAAVDRFESDVRSGPLGLIARVGRTPFGRERIKHVIRGRTPAAAAQAALRDPRTAVGDALRAARLIVVQAPSEAAELDRTFRARVSARAVWVPNGVTVDESVDVGGHRDIDVLVAGRIEERKNQLAVARAFAGSSVRVTFVGGENRRNAAYAARFHELVGQHGNLQHVPHVPLDELRRLYARTRVFVSTSWFEVVSLSELEAVAYGCRLVTGTGGYLRDYLGDLAVYVDPGIGPQLLRDTVAAALDGDPGDEAMVQVRSRFTWDRSHLALVEAYRSCGLLA